MFVLSAQSLLSRVPTVAETHHTITPTMAPQWPKIRACNPKRAEEENRRHQNEELAQFYLQHKFEDIVPRGRWMKLVVCVASSDYTDCTANMRSPRQSTGQLSWFENTFTPLMC